MIENTSYFLGEYMFTNELGPVIDKALNHYRIVTPIKSVIDGFNNVDYFTFDYRNVRDPVINGKDNSATFFIYGEF